MNNKIRHWIGLSLLALLTTFTGKISAQEDWLRLNRYETNNKELMESKKQIDAVFIGNSITQGWAGINPAFFTDNNYVGRGIGGQETLQIMARFNYDVISLHPSIVIINGGINDIAENLGKTYNAQNTFENIKAMVRMAQANNIKVILTSVLPAAKIHWRDSISNVPQKVNELNKMIKNFADENNITFVDYYTQMATTDGAMIAEFTTDGVHVTQEGYQVMEKLIKVNIDKLLSEKSN